MLVGRRPICFVLSGLSRSSPSNPGRRCALPWADMSQPLRGESGRPTCVKQRGLTPQATTCHRARCVGLQFGLVNDRGKGTQAQIDLCNDLNWAKEY